MEASLVPQHATEPAVALPISGVTSVCIPNGLRTSRIRIIATEAPTVIVICSGSTRTWLKWLNRICVPSETKHEFNEWKLPPTRSGDGYVSVSLTTSMSSSRFLGTATTLGLLEAELFQFLKVVVLAILSHLHNATVHTFRMGESAAPYPFAYSVCANAQSVGGLIHR